MKQSQIPQKGIAGLLGAVIIVGAAVVGCATADPAAIRQQLGETQSALNQAVDGNARQYAPLEVKKAEEKLKQANFAFETEDYARAGNLAEEAKADAALAEAIAENAKSQEMVDALKDSIEKLRQEIENSDSNN